MEYIKENIKEGITLHKITTNKFKTNILAVILTTKLDRKTVTKNALISSILRRGTRILKNQEEISKKLEEMYGAEFDCGLDKTGDNHALKFYIETVNDNFLPQKSENILKDAFETLLEIVFDPYIEDEGFKKEYLEQEKNKIKHIIEGRKDNKSRYALDRCIEEMYKTERYGLYKYGYVEDLEEINEKELYEYYKELINSCKIDIFVSGILDNKLEKIISSNKNIKKLTARKADYILSKNIKKETQNEKEVIEKMEVTQGKLIMGLDVNLVDESLIYSALVYNGILGGSANSKLFQNVREKEHLAYIASSNYLRYKSNIFINCGIDIPNYEKAVKIIKKQLEDMKNGNFTEEDIENSKKIIISGINTIIDEQDTQITFYYGQELSNTPIKIEEYIDNIQKVKKEDILKIAKNTNVNTVYFLRN